MDALALRRTNATTAERQPMKAIVEKLVDALAEEAAWNHQMYLKHSSGAGFIAEQHAERGDILHGKIAEAKAALAAPVSLAVGVDDEQNGFEQWAVSQKYDMECHPLHYLFLDSETWHARQGWREGVKFASLRARPAPEGMVLVPIEPTMAQCQNALDASRKFDGDARPLLITKELWAAGVVYRAMIAATERNKS